MVAAVWIPSWVAWVVVAIVAVPCLWFGFGVLALAVALGKDAQKNAETRTREALEVLACPDCRPLLPRAKCATHQWHTTPPPDAMP